MRATNRRGFTLIELMISITLVAALSSGVLMAMRAGLLTLDKTKNRMENNRRVLSVQQILQREISNAIPVLGTCAGGAQVSVFNGNPQTLHLVSSISVTEGARGYPRIVELQVTPADRGVRLIVNETLYAGPASIGAVCADGQFLPGRATPQSIVLADRLAYCRILYKSSDPESPKGGGWVEEWTRPDLPYAVRVEMAPLVPDTAGLPLLSVTARVPVTRQLKDTYYDVPYY